MLQIEVDEEDRDKTSFTSPHGLFPFIRTPFGLKEVPVTFQRVMDVTLETVKWQFAVVYIEDISIFLKSLSEHVEHIRQLLQLLSDAKVMLKLKKSSLFTNTVD